MTGANLGQAAPPWILWGQTKELIVPPTGLATPVPVVSDTVARAGYGRPDSWRWLFHCLINGGGTQTGVGETAIVEVTFDLITGVGRSAVVIPNFSTVQWDWSNGGVPFVGQPLFTNASRAQIQIGGAPLPVAEIPLMQEFVSQDITIVAKAAYITDTVGAVPVNLAVTAHLSPATHVRPDWYQVDAPPTMQFPGGETGGR